MKNIFFLAAVCALLYAIPASAQTNTFPASGNVGIGTTSPATSLQVSGGDILISNNQNFASGNSSGTATGILQVDTSNDLLLGATSLTGAVYFYNHGYFTNGVVPMMISSTGNVGIGTASPAQLLDVEAPGNVAQFGTTGDGFIYLNQATSGNNYLQFDHQVAGVDKWHVGIQPNTNDYGFWNANLSSLTLYLQQSTGNVGIGTSSPAASLDLSQRTDALALPSGTTGQRPTGANGMIRYNSSVNALEGYVNASWQALTTGGNFAINIMAWPYHAACDGTTNDTTTFQNAWATGLPVFVPQTSTGCALNAASMPSGATLMGNSVPQYDNLTGTRSFVVPASGASSIINIGSNSDQLFQNIDIFAAPSGCSGGACYTSNVQCLASSSPSNTRFLNASVRFCGNGGLGSGSSYPDSVFSESTTWYGNGQKNNSGGLVNIVDSQINGGTFTANYDGIQLLSGANSNVISDTTRLEFNIDFGVNCYQCTNEDIGGTYDSNSNGAIQFNQAGGSAGAPTTSASATGIKVHGVYTRNGSTATALNDADFVMLQDNVNISFTDITTWNDCGDEGCTSEPPDAPLYIFDFKDNTNVGIRIGPGNYTGYLTAPIHYATSAPADFGVVGALGIAPTILPYENDVNGNMLVSQVSTPAAPAITTAGTTGAATWTYNVTCLVSSGGAHTAGSATGSTSTGNATLSTTNYNIITISPSQGCYQYAIRRTAHGTSPSTNGLIATVPAQQLVVLDTGLAGDSTTAPTDNTTGTVLGAGGVRNGLDSFVASDFSKTSTTTLAAITGLSANLYAGKTYAFELWLYTTSNSASGIKFDLNGGTATATTLIGDSMEEDGTTFGTRTAYSSLSTGLCGITAVSTATCHITGTIVVNAAGTFAPRFAQNVSGATASVVKTGSIMTVRPLN